MRLLLRASIGAVYSQLPKHLLDRVRESYFYEAMPLNKVISYGILPASCTSSDSYDPHTNPFSFASQYGSVILGGSKSLLTSICDFGSHVSTSNASRYTYNPFSVSFITRACIVVNSGEGIFILLSKRGITRMSYAPLTPFLDYSAATPRTSDCGSPSYMR